MRASATARLLFVIQEMIFLCKSLGLQGNWQDVEVFYAK